MSTPFRQHRRRHGEGTEARVEATQERLPDAGVRATQEPLPECCRKARPRLADLPGRSPASAKRVAFSLGYFSLGHAGEK